MRNVRSNAWYLWREPRIGQWQAYVGGWLSPWPQSRPRFRPDASRKAKPPLNISPRWPVGSPCSTARISQHGCILTGQQAVGTICVLALIDSAIALEVRVHCRHPKSAMHAGISSGPTSVRSDTEKKQCYTLLPSNADASPSSNRPLTPSRTTRCHRSMLIRLLTWRGVVRACLSRC
ncbi:hypothetical protein CKAH01_12373 [Colletotrichum kahawae]|uniref:Uncharacterized protein n=1 Tax=Colletotrichum kahawae TaxID=34407 RepID=A0AAD9YTP0_COLKA|nr:hypothetical protein CKAH01_12373 [Colletotrichum kahawae]